MINNIDDLIADFRGNDIVLWGNEYCGFFQVTHLNTVVNIEDGAIHWQYRTNYTGNWHTLYNCTTKEEWNRFKVIPRKLLFEGSARC